MEHIVYAFRNRTTGDVIITGWPVEKMFEWLSKLGDNYEVVKGKRIFTDWEVINES